MSSERQRIFISISDERVRQDEKWGEATNRDLPLTVWDVVLSEEIGECAEEVEALVLAWLNLKLTKHKGKTSEAILKHQRENLRTELIQTAAVAVAMLECLEDASWGVNDSDAG